MAKRRQQPPQPDNEPPLPDDEGSYRVLPHNLEAERAVLGAVLLDNQGYYRAIRHVHAETFFRLAHQLIWRAYVKLLEARAGAVDLTILREALATSGTLEDVGGPAYIASLVDGTPRGVNIEHYARIVKEKAQLRACIAVGTKLTSDAYAGDEPPAVIISAADKAIVDLQHARSEQLRTMADTSTRILDRLEYRVAHRGEVTGVPTGFKSIDEDTSGWQPGDMIVIGARPSIGKTSFVLCSAVASAKAGKRILLFSMEMKHEQLEDRLLAAETNIDLSRLRSGHIRDDEWGPLSQAIGAMHEWPLAIDDAPSCSVSDIRGGCRRYQSDGGLDLVIIDYVQLMPGTLQRRGATRNDEITDISRRLKVLAGDLGVPIILLSQLRRISERMDPRPKIEDLRESGSLEQDADIVAFLHRSDHRTSGTTEFIIAKARNGPTTTTHLTFTRELCRFSDGGEPLPPPTEEEKQAARTRHIIRNRQKK